MATKARLKFVGLTYEQEHKLIQEGGFIVYSRKRKSDDHPGWVILEKLVRDYGKGFEVLYGGKLPPDIQLHLTRRCNKIASMFPTNPGTVKMRCERIASTLPRYQAAFIKDWIKENVDDGQEAPWEDDMPLFLKRSHLT